MGNAIKNPSTERSRRWSPIERRTPEPQRSRRLAADRVCQWDGSLPIVSASNQPAVPDRDRNWATEGGPLTAILPSLDIQGSRGNRPIEDGR
jgi:hypothetical protein